MQVTTGKRYVSDGAATGKWQMAAGSIRYCRYKKLCFSAQLTGFRNRYGLDISGQKFLQTWQVLRVDAGEHLEDAGCIGRIFPAEQEIISRYSEGLAEPCQYRDGKVLGAMFDFRQEGIGYVCGLRQLLPAVFQFFTAFQDTAADHFCVCSFHGFTSVFRYRGSLTNILANKQYPNRLKKD